MVPNINMPTHQVKLTRPQGGNWRCKMYAICEYVTDAINQTSILPLFHLSENELQNQKIVVISNNTPAII